MIGTPKKSSSPVTDSSKDSEPVAVDLHDKLSLVNINENQNVIIAQHIRVPETDRCRLTFGSFGVDLDSTRNFASGVSAVGSTEENNRESTARFVFFFHTSCFDMTVEFFSCYLHFQWCLLTV